MTYDGRGRLLSVTDVDGRVRRYEYGNLAVPTQITDRDGSTIAIEYQMRRLPTKSTERAPV